MKVRIAREDLLTPLSKEFKVWSKSETPCRFWLIFLLEAKSDGLDVLATDLEIGMRGLYKAALLTIRVLSPFLQENYLRFLKRFASRRLS